MDPSKPNPYFEIYIIFLRFHTMQSPKFSYLMAIARIQLYVFMHDLLNSTYGLHGSPNLRDGLKIIPSRVIFHSSQVSGAYGSFPLALPEGVFTVVIVQRPMAFSL